MSIDSIINETQLNIIINSNIPGEQPFSLTKNILQSENLNVDGFSEYPYFSSAVLYPESELTKLKYNEAVAFFFQQETFVEKLKETAQYKDNALKLKQDEINKMNARKEALEKQNTGEKVNIFSQKQESQEDKLAKANKKNETINKNIMTMLRLIFPTNYPTSDNISSSYDILFSSTFLQSSSIANIIPFLMNAASFGTKPPNNYSYIKSPSKGICTVTRVVWLNDIYNHPQYKLIAKEYEKFQEWKAGELKKETDELVTLIDNFKKKHTQEFDALTKHINTIDAKKSPKLYQKNLLIGEFNSLKSTLLPITSGNFKISDLIVFRRLMNKLKEFLELDQIRSEFNIDNVTKDIGYIEFVDEILTKYLNNPDIPIENEDSQNDDEKAKLKRLIVNEWNGYKKYSEFTKFIGTFVSPNMETSNILLQNELENFSKNKKNRIEEIAIPLNSTKSEIKPLIETGISIKSNDAVNNEIQVRIDVILGKLDDTNKGVIDCLFQSESLGNQFEGLLTAPPNFWELDPNNFFFDLNSIKNNTEQSNESKIKNQENKVSINEQPVINEKQPILRIQGGFYKHSRVRRKNKNKNKNKTKRKVSKSEKISKK
jgi:hypothetical protein